MSGGPEFYVDDAGEHRWRVRASNGRILGDSGEGYTAGQTAAEEGLADLLEELGVTALYALASAYLPAIVQGRHAELLEHVAKLTRSTAAHRR